MYVCFIMAMYVCVYHAMTACMCICVHIWVESVYVVYDVVEVVVLGNEVCLRCADVLGFAFAHARHACVSLAEDRS